MTRPGLVAAMPLEMYFDLISTKIDSKKSACRSYEFNIGFTDTDEDWRLDVKKGVLDAMEDAPSDEPTATLRMNRSALNKIAQGDPPPVHPPRTGFVDLRRSPPRLRAVASGPAAGRGPSSAGGSPSPAAIQLS